MFMSDRIAVDTQLDSYMSATELSRVLGISRSGVFTLVRNGELPKGIRLGHSRRWSVSEIRDFLKTKGGTGHDY